MVHGEHSAYHIQIYSTTDLLPLIPLSLQDDSCLNIGVKVMSAAAFNSLHSCNMLSASFLVSIYFHLLFLSLLLP